MTSALMRYFVKEKHLGVGKCSSTLDALISCLVYEAVKFSLEVLSVFEHFCFLSFVVGVVKGNQPVGVDVGGEVLVNE